MLISPARTLAGARAARLVALFVLVALVTACGKDEDRVVVLAASSLNDAFGVVEAGYESAHPGVDVVVSFGGSSSLAAQVEQGAPADVFASADLATMDRLAADTSDTAELDLEPTVFARNRLVIAVAPGNPVGIRGLADLARDDVIVVLAAPEVPAGAYAAQVLAAAGLNVEPASFEQNVRSVASKVALGEADAGIVYVTDVASRADRLESVSIPTELVAEYPIVALTARGADFVDFVTGPAGRSALLDAGFEVP